jgi:hypothetical protein
MQGNSLLSARNCLVTLHIAWATREARTRLLDTAKEQERLHNFKTIFRPAASKQSGYIDVQMLKLRSALQGKEPGNYRLVLTFVSEELRQKWIASATQQRVWPTIENTLTSKNYTVLLYDTP